MHVRIVLSCLLLMASPLVGRSDPVADFIDTQPNGAINWTRGDICVQGMASPRADSEPQADSEVCRAALALQARFQALQNLLDLLGNVRMDADTRVLDQLSADQGKLERIKHMVDRAAVTAQEDRPDGSVLVRMQFPLRGAFAQLMLPSDIKQVEQIKPVINAPASDVPKNPEDRDEAADAHAAPFTGLVVDARGIDLRPALVPLIVDENGRELYSPDYISREYAVQQGVCEYVEGSATTFTMPEERVGTRPLVIKALRARAKENCDIVISNSEASRLRDIGGNLEFLKKCRVVIVIDRVSG